MKDRFLALLPPFMIMAVAVAIFFLIVPLLNLSPIFFERVLSQADLPTDSWTLCADLGIGPVPGQVGDLQRVLMCHASGWQVQAFCFEPNKPVPPVNTLCSMVSSTDFWCGDTFQQLREFQIVSTPQADTPAPSLTPTSTLTPTLTSTPVAPTLTPSLTPALPTPTAPSQNSPTPSATAQPTVFNRPSPGGTGNLELLVSLAATTAGLSILTLAVVLRGKMSRKVG